LVLNGELRVWVIFLRHNITPAGSSYWRIRRRVRRQPDLTMAIRMDCNHADIQDFYLLPDLGTTVNRLCLAAQNGVDLDAFRFETLDFLVGMAARAKLSEVP